uniref:Uncharacterized protein n=1 Tax=Gracilaria edulis TaxID=172966 RepID=A0A6C0A8P5_9FLOR|nr:hypothetical protein [Gracilaria edulis]QHS70554.1 hypothetical protein [Gracilaria edulis]UAD85692.1 hypothetical protein [Gracilaria edulis]
MELLFISIEAINLYNLDDNSKNQINFINRLNHIFLIRCGNLTKHPKVYTLHNFNESIQLINCIHNLMCDYKIQKNINEMFNTIYKNQKSSKIKQYLNRFKYIYYKIQNYYNIISETYYDDKYITEIALLNLYIMYISSNKDGIYFLIKYLKLSSHI